MLTPLEIPDPRIVSGKFGRCGKMVIKPYEIPEEDKEKFLKVFRSLVIIDICGCWEWKGRTHNGYGCFPEPGGNTKWAHRVSYALFVGPISGGMHIDHTCRNRKCVRPDHLQQVTPTENYLAIYERKRKDVKELLESRGQLSIYDFTRSL